MAFDVWGCPNLKLLGYKMMSWGLVGEAFDVWGYNLEVFGLQNEFLAAVGEVFDVWTLQIGGLWATK